MRRNNNRATTRAVKKAAKAAKVTAGPERKVFKSNPMQCLDLLRAVGARDRAQRDLDQKFRSILAGHGYAQGDLVSVGKDSITVEVPAAK